MSGVGYGVVVRVGMLRLFGGEAQTSCRGEAKTS
jgi:hypothetical protein